MAPSDPTGVFAAVVTARPLSLNRSGPTTRYVAQIQRAALAQDASQLTGPLYARIIWFQLRRSPGDVDNIAKPILDALKTIVFRDDDDIVRCLTQKTVADTTGQFALDPLRIPSEQALTDLLAALGTHDHVLYIEVGPVADLTVSFGPVQ